MFFKILNRFQENRAYNLPGDVFLIAVLYISHETKFVSWILLVTLGSTLDHGNFWRKNATHLVIFLSHMEYGRKMIWSTLYINKPSSQFS